jgi:hypothetical protein
MGSEKLDFFLGSKDILRKFNVLGNRLLHRVVYIHGYSKQNIAVVMNQVDGSGIELIERKLGQLQKELLKKVNNNQDYSILANEIYRLRDGKEAALDKNAGFSSQKQRMAEMTKFLKEQ